MSHEKRLLPCPFCGSDAEIFGETATYVRCSSDQCISHPEPFNDYGHRRSAIEAWNRRTAPLSPGLLRAAEIVLAKYTELSKRGYPPPELLMELHDSIRAESSKPDGQPECVVVPVRVKEEWEQLIFAVARKHPNETRFQTALRYINQAESGGTDQCAAKEPK